MENLVLAASRDLSVAERVVEACMGQVAPVQLPSTPLPDLDLDLDLDLDAMLPPSPVLEPGLALDLAPEAPVPQRAQDRVLAFRRDVRRKVTAKYEERVNEVLDSVPPKEAVRILRSQQSVDVSIRCVRMLRETALRRGMFSAVPVFRDAITAMLRGRQRARFDAVCDGVRELVGAAYERQGWDAEVRGFTKEVIAFRDLEHGSLKRCVGYVLARAAHQLLVPARREDEGVDPIFVRIVCQAVRGATGSYRPGVALAAMRMLQDAFDVAIEGTEDVGQDPYNTVYAARMATCNAMMRACGPADILCATGRSFEEVFLYHFGAETARVATEYGDVRLKEALRNTMHRCREGRERATRAFITSIAIRSIRNQVQIGPDAEPMPAGAIQLVGLDAAPQS